MLIGGLIVRLFYIMRVIKLTGNFDFEINETADFFLHICAHKKTNSAADNYDQNYIEKIKLIKKESFSSLAENLAELDLDNLFYLSFVAMYINSASIFIRIVESAAGIKSDDLQPQFSEIEQGYVNWIVNILPPNEDFLKFALILRNEYFDFYHDYHQSTLSNRQLRLVNYQEYWHSSDNQNFIIFFQKHQLPPIRIILSEAMLKNGRIANPNNLGIALITKLPDNSNEFFYSSFVAVHEMLHLICDPLTTAICRIDPNQRSTNPEDANFAIHKKLEMSVLYTHYKLIEKFQTDKISSYLNILGCNNEEEFFTNFSISNDIKNELEKKLDL